MHVRIDSDGRYNKQNLMSQHCLIGRSIYPRNCHNLTSVTILINFHY